MNLNKPNLDKNQEDKNDPWIIKEKTKIYEAALEHIRSNLGSVCEKHVKHGKCDHRACRESLEAWITANVALTTTKAIKIT